MKLICPAELLYPQHIRHHQGPFSLIGSLVSLRWREHFMIWQWQDQWPDNPIPSPCSDPPTVHVCRNFSPKPKDWQLHEDQRGLFNNTSLPFARPTQPCDRLCKDALMIAALYIPSLFAFCSVKAGVEGSCWVFMTLEFGQADLSERSGSVTRNVGTPLQPTRLESVG